MKTFRLDTIPEMGKKMLRGTRKFWLPFWHDFIFLSDRVKLTLFALLLAISSVSILLLVFDRANGIETSLVATAQQSVPENLQHAPTLREIYSRPVSDWPEPFIDEGVNYEEMAPLDLLPRPKRDSIEAKRVALGRRLFVDPILSASNQIACQSCHNRRLGWGDGVRTSFGDHRQLGNRNAPSVISSAYRQSLFWDGRAANLVEQAHGPIANPVEMAADPKEIEQLLQMHPNYPDLFEEAYGAMPLTMDDVAQALADFQRHLERPTRFDRFLRGNQRALTDRQIEGLHIFRTKGRCMNCHSGALLADDKFHNIGLTFYGRRLQDLGRYNITSDPEDVGAFRTPSLRHLNRTGPYMHNGIFPVLRGVVAFYNIGGGDRRPRTPEQAKDPLFPKKSPLMKPLKLSRQEMDALADFLEAL